MRAATLFLLLATACTSTLVESDLESIAAASQKKYALPQLSIVVMQRGDVIFERDADTIHQIGSISKQFTAAAIMQLAERGALRLDGSAREILPWLPESWSEVRVHHLLQQTSGVPEFLFHPEFMANSGDVARPASELRAIITSQPMGFVPGSRWAYSNSNYTLLAAIIERLSGVSYDEFINRELLTPARLPAIQHCPPLPASAAEARGHTLRPEGVVPSPAENMNWARGDGGLCASARSLAKWGEWLAVQPMLADMTTASGVSPAYGYGLSLVPLDGSVRKIAHHGAMGGFTGMLSIYPEHELVIAVLMNRGGVSADAIEKPLARRVLGLRPPRYTPVRTATLPVGTFDTGAFPVTLEDRNGVLFMSTPPPAPSGEFIGVGEKRWALASDPDALQLHIDPATGRLVLTAFAMEWFLRTKD